MDRMTGLTQINDKVMQSRSVREKIYSTDIRIICIWIVRNYIPINKLIYSDKNPTRNIREILL
jgi:hypothetical protein